MSRPPWLTVRLPASTRVRLTLRLAMRARRPSYASPFDDAGPADLPAGKSTCPAATTAVAAGPFPEALRLAREFLDPWPA